MRSHQKRRDFPMQNIEKTKAEYTDLKDAKHLCLLHQVSQNLTLAVSKYPLMQTELFLNVEDLKIERQWEYLGMAAACSIPCQLLCWEYTIFRYWFEYVAFLHIFVPV